MDNPYQAPESEIAVDPIQNRVLRKGWLAFFVVMLLVEIVSNYTTFIDISFNESLTKNLFEFLIDIPFLVALFCLSFDIGFGKRKIWLAYLPILMSYDLYSAFNGYKEAQLKTGNPGAIFFAMLLVCLIVFLRWYAIFRYSKTLSETKN